MSWNEPSATSRLPTPRTRMRVLVRQRGATCTSICTVYADVCEHHDLCAGSGSESAEERVDNVRVMRYA